MNDLPNEIKQFYTFLQRPEFQISVLPKHTKTQAKRWRFIRLQLNDEVREIPVCDDYDDCEKPNRLVWLHLVLRACEWYRESQDFEEWRVDSEAPQDQAHALFEATGQVVADIEDWLGSELTAISDWDFEMNTGLTRTLRAFNEADGIS